MWHIDNFENCVLYLRQQLAQCYSIVRWLNSIDLTEFYLHWLRLEDNWILCNTQKFLHFYFHIDSMTSRDDNDDFLSLGSEVCEDYRTSSVLCTLQETHRVKNKLGLIEMFKESLILSRNWEFHSCNSTYTTNECKKWKWTTIEFAFLEYFDWNRVFNFNKWSRHSLKTN